MKDTDRSMLRVLAALLRAKTMPDGAAEEFAAFLDRIAGEGEFCKIAFSTTDSIKFSRPCPNCKQETDVSDFTFSDHYPERVCLGCAKSAGVQRGAHPIPTFQHGMPPGCDTAMFTKDGIGFGKRVPPVHSDPHDWITDPLTGEQQ